MTRRGIILTLGIAAFLLCASDLPAADPVVLRVVVVSTDNPDAYVKEVERGRGMMKRLESPALLRVWRARYAGEDAGSVVVSIEYPNMAALARDETRLSSDGEFQAWLKGLDKLRKVVSDSIYNELK